MYTMVIGRLNGALLKAGVRHLVSMIAISGEVVDSHSAAVLIGYGASDFDIFPLLSEIDFGKILWIEKDSKNLNPRVKFFLYKKGGYVCYVDILQLFNKIIDRYDKKYERIKKPIDSRCIANLENVIQQDIPILYRYILVSKIFLILLKLDEAKKVIRTSYKKAKSVIKPIKANRGKLNNEIKAYLKNYYLILGSIYNQKGNLIKAYFTFRKNLKMMRNLKDIFGLCNAKLNIINSLIMLRKLKEAKSYIKKLKEEIEKIEKNERLTESEKEILNRINRRILDYKIKIEEIEYSIKKIKKLQYFDKNKLDKLKEKYTDEGNIDQILDCDLYLYRLEFYNNKNNKKSLQSLKEKYTNLCDKIKLSGNVMSYINALRDKSNIEANLEKYEDVINIHKYILKISSEYGKDYQTENKSYLYLTYSYFKLKKPQKFFIYLLKYIKSCLSHFLFTPNLIFVNFKRFFKFK